MAVVGSHADEMTVMQQIGAESPICAKPNIRHQATAGGGALCPQGGVHGGARARRHGSSVMRAAMLHDGGLHHVGDGLHVTLLIVLLDDMRQRWMAMVEGGIICRRYKS